MNSKLKKLRTELLEIYHLECCMSILGYDQQVFMPVAASASRAQQLEYLSTLLHRKQSSESLWELVQDLESQADQFSSDEQVIIRETYRSISKKRKLPEAFVAEKTKVCSESYSVWAEKMRDSSLTDNQAWESVMPYLAKIVDLSRQESAIMSDDSNPYQALIDNFEPYAKISEVKPLLLSLAERLQSAIPALAEKYADTAQIKTELAIEQQKQLCTKILTQFGFNFNAGRIDSSAHPFMSNLGENDIRLTTRYNKSNFLPALFGTIHEFGHALYEMGLQTEYKGTPRGSAISMAIHESQSRLWENMVARSHAFSAYLVKLVTNQFDLKIKTEDLYTYCNIVRPSLIRVEADELSYSLHIVIRMIIEEMLVSGSLQVEDLPECWNSLYEKYLGIKPKGHKQAQMQDIHWYSGYIGYFPSYALGNLYAAMFMEKFEKDCGTLHALIESEQLMLLNSWLKQNIHQHGQTYNASQLVEHVCGSSLSTEPFLNYLSQKHQIKI